MSTPKIFESEYRFCLILWEREPVSSAELAKICKEKLGWSRTTTYTVIHRLSERGAGGGARRAGRKDVRGVFARVRRGLRAQDEAVAVRGRSAARHDRRI